MVDYVRPEGKFDYGKVAVDALVTGFMPSDLLPGLEIRIKI